MHDLNDDDDDGDDDDIPASDVVFVCAKRKFDLILDTLPQDQSFIHFVGF